jgi:hypothetical protein
MYANWRLYLGDVNFFAYGMSGFRETKHTESPFAGVLKIEKVLVNDR